jgi:gamma-glutamyltranspeptidase / glutathione hydrolase
VSRQHGARAMVVSPHHLASEAGRQVLADGGNAVDAAVATGLALAVATPYHCGLGGDLVAQVWDGAPTGVLSAGAAPAGATPTAVRHAIDEGHGTATSEPGTSGMPTRGALTVTVPGAVAGWFHLLSRWGTRSFGTVAAPALALARDGLEVSEHGAALARDGLAALAEDAPLVTAFGRMRTPGRFTQPELAATLERLADEGPDGFYRGALAERIVTALAAGGSTMTTDDLAAHTVEQVAPLRGTFRDLEVLQLPPPTQGVTALTALGLLETLGPLPDHPALAVHLQVEAVRAAMADRQEHLGDPVDAPAGAALLDEGRLRALAAGIDPDRAATWPPARPIPGGTAYLCAADADGLVVSLSQSNFRGFGSGVMIEGAGFGLHNRGAHFTLGTGPGRIGPGRRPRHTLIPALVLRDGVPRLLLGTMGGDAQPQIHVQLLTRLLDEGLDLDAALDAPRFVVAVADGAVSLEQRTPIEIVEGLRARGHRVRGLPDRTAATGHAHLLAVGPDGYMGATDPRTEGAVNTL